MNKSSVIVVIGLGYVGLPLAVEFGKHYRTIGFDINQDKVEKCNKGIDPSKELSSAKMAQGVHTTYTSDPRFLAEADFIIVAVPTPVNDAHIPDFGPLLGASKLIGQYGPVGVVVVYESTVYPGATEEICIPAIEAASIDDRRLRSNSLKWKKNFNVGYSPERINPGDRQRTLVKVMKIVAGDTPETLDDIAELYETIIRPGVHRASSIKVAEAAKVIENTQRDLNIALMNELAIIFNKLDIDTNEVLEAAGTKWNFLNFRPGLVGGHCIGVDPYYLTHKAQSVGYHPEVILAGRRINDGMGKYIAEQTIKQMIASGAQIKGARVNVLGLTFKENCADIRNSKVIDIIDELESYGVCVFVTDPWAQHQEATDTYPQVGILWKLEEMLPAAATIVAVAHNEYKAMLPKDFLKITFIDGCLIDVKSIAPKEELEKYHGLKVWRL